MSVTREEIERIHDIKKSLEITYKSSTTPSQRARLKNEIDEINSIIELINEGKWVNPLKLKIFGHTKNNKSTGNEAVNENTEYDKVKLIPFVQDSRDDEMDVIYSYFVFFENNFYQIFSQRSLKLRFDAGKKRDEFLASYDFILRQVEQYQSDIVDAVRKTDQTREQRNNRLNMERFNLLGRLQDFFKELLEFVITLNQGIAQGEKIILNPQDSFFDEQNVAEFSHFEGKKIFEVLKELEIFLRIFLTKIDIPDFLRGKKN